MNIRRLQGAALIISAVIGLIGLIGSGTSAVRYLFVLGALLLMFGVPAIQSLQPAGILGWIGIGLIELAALVALVLNLTASGSSVASSTIPLLSALAGGIGRIIVGWITARRDVFPQWVGWAFIAEGVLNFIGGQLNAASLASAIGIIVALVGAAALLTYGWFIMNRSAVGSQTKAV